MDFHVITSLLDAARAGDMARVHALVDDGADINAQGDYEHGMMAPMTALMHAAGEGHEACVRALVDELGADVNMPNFYGYTALMYAAQEGQEACARALIELGADIDTMGSDEMVNEHGCGNLTALMHAATNPLVDLVTFSTYINKAVGESHEACMRTLVELGADVNMANECGYTALMFAAMTGREACVRALIKLRADVNKANKDGGTALMLAETGGFAAIAAMIRAEM